MNWYKKFCVFTIKDCEVFTKKDVDRILILKYDIEDIAKFKKQSAFMYVPYTRTSSKRNTHKYICTQTPYTYIHIYMHRLLRKATQASCNDVRWGTG